MSDYPIGAEFDDSAPYNEKAISISAELIVDVAIEATVKGSFDKKEDAEELINQIEADIAEYLEKYQHEHYTVNLTVFK